MKKMIILLLALALLCPMAVAETAANGFSDEDYGDPSEAFSADVEVTGDFEPPAMTSPEARYDTFLEKTDGSEEAVFLFIDYFNDEATDIAEYGALHIAERYGVDESGEAAMTVGVTIQDSPFGMMLIATIDDTDGETSMYSVGTTSFMMLYDEVMPVDGYAQDEYEYYITSYHFPYGYLDMLNGMRQDENGYTYMFATSSETRCFEYVMGSGMKIVQLRVYDRGEDGVLALDHLVDYSTGPAKEVPQAVIDAFDAVLPRVETGESESNED